MEKFKAFKASPEPLQLLEDMIDSQSESPLSQDRVFFSSTK